MLLVVAVCSAWPNVAGEQMHPLLNAVWGARGLLLPVLPSSHSLNTRLSKACMPMAEAYVCPDIVAVCPSPCAATHQVPIIELCGLPATHRWVMSTQQWALPVLCHLAIFPVPCTGFALTLFCALHLQAAAAAPNSRGSNSQQNAAASVLHDTHLPPSNKEAAAAQQSRQQPTTQQAAAHSGTGAAALKGVEGTKNVSSSSSRGGSQLADTLALTKATVARQMSIAQQEYQQAAGNVTSED